MLPADDKLLRKLAAGIKPVGRITASKSADHSDASFMKFVSNAQQAAPPAELEFPSELDNVLQAPTKQAIAALTDHATTQAHQTLLIITPNKRITIDTDSRKITRYADTTEPIFLDGVDAIAAIDADGKWTDSSEVSSNHDQTGTLRAKQNPAFAQPANASLLSTIAQAQQRETPAESGTPKGTEARK